MARKTTVVKEAVEKPLSPQQRAKNLMQQINAVFGAEVVKVASDDYFNVTYSPTGLLPFDLIMPGGVPKGRMIEVYGGPSTLKSYMALCAIAEVQRQGGVAALIDTERTFDPDWAVRIGVDLAALITLPRGVDTGEQAFDIAEQILRSRVVDLLVVDSVAAALPQVEANKPLYESKIQPGQHAKMMSMGLRKLTAANAHTSIIFINQTRMNIGVTFGSPEVTTGGKALPFYASMRLKVSQSGKEQVTIKKSTGGDTLRETKETVGQWYTIEVIKSKLSKPFGTTTFLWDLKTGTIDVARYLFAEGLNGGIISQTGSRYDVLGNTINGRDKAVEHIRANESVAVDLEWMIREAAETVAVTEGAAMVKTAKTLPVEPPSSPVRGRKPSSKATTPRSSTATAPSPAGRRSVARRRRNLAG